MTAAIINYVQPCVDIVEVPEELQRLDGDDIISRMGFPLGDIHYMIVENPINLNILTKEIKCELTFK